MLKLDVKFYDKEHRSLLEKLSSFSAMENYVDNGFLVHPEIFLVYSVFVHQKQIDDFRTYNDLKRLLSKYCLFEEYFELNETVRSRFANSDDQRSNLTEEAGVGAALSLASSLYDLTEADWERKPDRLMKDLDFKIASTGKHYIEVEAKGAIVEDVTVKVSKISNKKADIGRKKNEQRNDFNNQNTLIGVIAAIPSNKQQHATCYLLDPPAGEQEEDAFKYKLLARLYYYWRELHIISKTHLLAALATRIKDIELVRDYKSLDSMPLLNRNNNEFDVPSSLFSSLSTTEAKIAFGEIIPQNESETEYFFYGMAAEIPEMLIEQNFKNIANLKFAPESFPEIRITARVKKSELKQYKGRLFNKDNEETEEPGLKSRKEIKMVANLFKTPAGRVFGYARPIYKDYRNDVNSR